MKKILLIFLTILLFSFTSEAARGFGAKVYNDKNINFMSIAVDYDNNKIKVITSNLDIDYIIISRISSMDKSILYIGAILASDYNYGHYDTSKAETFIFDTKNSLFSTNSSTTKRRIEIFTLERNL